jgi:uncharacterized RDD family membrane protein YckC
VKRAGAHRYAGFWRRVAATLIDTLIYSVALGLLLGPTIMEAALFTLEGALRMAIALLATIVLWIKFLGTPGKLLLACQVVDADTHAPLSLKQSILRYVGYLLSLLPLLLGILWILKDPRKQGFHDKIANSVVLHNAGIEAGIERDDESRKSLRQLMQEVR